MQEPYNWNTLDEAAASLTKMSGEEWTQSDLLYAAEQARIKAHFLVPAGTEASDVRCQLGAELMPVYLAALRINDRIRVRMAPSPEDGSKPVSFDPAPWVTKADVRLSKDALACLATADQVPAMFEAYKETRSFAKVGERFHITGEGVQKKLRKAGLIPPRPSKAPKLPRHKSAQDVMANWGHKR